MSKMRTLLAAAAIATVPFASQAITVLGNLDETGTNLASSQPFMFGGFTKSGEMGGSYSYDFENDFDTAISFGITAAAGPNIIDGITLTFSDGTILDLDSNDEESASPIFAAGEEFSFVLDYGATRELPPGSNGGRFGFLIDVAQVAAVPLPAGALLLTTALGGMALSRRRKSAADKA